MSDYGSARQPDSGMFGDFELRDYIDIARRRKWWIILTAVAIAVMVAVIVSRIPNFYRSDTVIMVDPQQVPSNYVASPVTSSIQDRLSTIQQQVMSPSRLQKVIDTLALYPDLRGRAPDQDIIARMQKATTIEVANAGDRRLSSFKITFQAADPKTAALVANELANQFISENLKVREDQFTGTTDFLNSELQSTKKQLEDKEAEMGRMKSQYIMDLPESKQFHLEALTSLQAQMRQSQDRVSNDQQQKVMLQSMMATSNPAVDLDSDTNGSSSPLQQEIGKVQSQLSDMRSHYGPAYPDVRKLETELKELKAQKAQEEKDNPQPKQTVSRKTATNPVLEAQIEKLSEQIDTETKRQPEIQQQIDFHSSKLEREPVFEEQIAGLMRDYDTLRAHYNALLDKKLSAQMATQLESRQEGERFVILDAAQPPDGPSGPNRPILTFAGVIIGLFAGFAFAVVLEMMDESVRTEREAEQILGKSIMTGIPRIYTGHQIAAARLRVAGALVVTVIVATGLGLALSNVALGFF